MKMLPLVEKLLADYSWDYEKGKLTRPFLCHFIEDQSYPEMEKRALHRYIDRCLGGRLTLTSLVYDCLHENCKRLPPKVLGALADCLFRQYTLERECEARIIWLKYRISVLERAKK